MGVGIPVLLSRGFNAASGILVEKKKEKTGWAAKNREDQRICLGEG